MSRIKWSGIAVAAVVASLVVVEGSWSSSTSSNPAAAADRARGTVFHDQNGDGARDEGEPGLAGVRVSNGGEIVTTDENGRYEIEVTDDTIVFVIKPSGWRTPLDENQLPRFFYIHKPGGSPESRFPGVAPTGPLPASIDFALQPQQEPVQFRALLFGDPQPRNQRELDFIAHDVLEELVGTDASFGVTLGDILFDDLSMFGSQSRAVGLLGIPWYNVIGNHDINFEAVEDRHSDETFERNFGPAYYSFDYGAAHFLVLDDVEWSHPPGEDGGYVGGLGPRQMEFIANDLAAVPDERLVVLLMHIPLKGVKDRQELYRLIEARSHCISVSGHTHHHEHVFVDEADGWRGAKPHHHLINVTVSGSWWSGAPDERGIPHTLCADGTPNGYTYLEIDSADYSFRYKAASQSADHQMEIHAPEQVAVGALEEATVSANVFNGSARSRVEMQVGGGGWVPMRQVMKIDPTYRARHRVEAAIADKPWRTMSNPKTCPHLWQATLPDGLAIGTHLIRVRSEDMFGWRCEDGRVLRVVE